MPVAITYFVHGTTTDNEQDLATGWLPGTLSELGLRQAKELGGLVAGTHFDAVFCSDLKRAVDSAELGFGNTYTIIPDARLRECNYGDLNGIPNSEVGEITSRIETAFPHGESFRDVERRMADFVKFLKSNYEDKRVAIVAHRAPQLALDVLLKGKTWEQAIAEDWRHTKSWRPGWEYTIA